MLNLTYVHLRERQEHAEKCTARRCADGCGLLGLEQWLAAPLTEADALADERVQQRSAAILRGDI